jgi:hypothetical protein
MIVLLWVDAANEGELQVIIDTYAYSGQLSDRQGISIGLSLVNSY